MSKSVECHLERRPLRACMCGHVQQVCDVGASQPGCAQVTIIARRPDDELLLLASDGLWDVLSNQVRTTPSLR